MNPAILFLLLSGFFYRPLHPVHVSVVTIEHNAGQHILEISCRTFTSDIEKTLRKNYAGKVDLLKPQKRGAMDSLLNDYLRSRLSVEVNDRQASLVWIGYEQDQDAIMSYFEVDEVDLLKKISVTDNILYDFSNRQVSIIQVKAGGREWSRQLTNPEDKAMFLF